MQLMGQLTLQQDLFQTTVELVEQVIFYPAALVVVGVNPQQNQHQV